MLYTMKDVLYVAQQHQFAVPAFNISSYEIFQSVLQTAQEANAPVIVEVHPDELAFVGTSFIEAMKDAAKRASIPVVIHLDHGGSIEDVKKAINCGFTSVMIDGSALPYEDNIKQTQEVVALAHETNVSVEAELGSIGQTGTSMEGGSQGVVYTDPAQAKDFVTRTGIDSLAVAIGTAHGLYPKDFQPKLQLSLLQEIHDEVDLPLVLHGGSANPDEEVEASLVHGICKINISSDVKNAFFKELRTIVQEHPTWYEPNQIYPSCMKAASSIIEHKIKLFHALGKASLYRQ